MGWASSGFEIGNTLDRRSYPAARPRRSGAPSPSAPPPEAGVPAFAAPRTRIVNFYIEVGANQRSTRSRGPLQGPALVLECRTVADPVAANDNAFFFPGYSASPVEEALVAVGGAINWPTWFDRMPQQGADLDASTRGITNATGLTQKIDWNFNIRGVVPLGTWYLTMTVGQVGGAAGFAWTGYVVVLEGIDPAVIGQYLG